ncbi:MAG: hypothetical protein V2I33_16255, partial [Kangiellaceae bacterium]|nr:hypothetical protein [Kangiellaceae bacterium]
RSGWKTANRGFQIGVALELAQDFGQALDINDCLGSQQPPLTKDNVPPTPGDVNMHTKFN